MSSSTCSGCAIRPEIVGVRRPAVEHGAAPAAAAVIEIEAATDVSVDATAVADCDCSTKCMHRWLCTGWTGLLFGVSLAAGMLAIVYLSTTLIPLASNATDAAENGPAVTSASM